MFWIAKYVYRLREAAGAGVFGMLSVMYITDSRFLRVYFGKVKSDARQDQLITFTRCLHEALPIKYRDLPRDILWLVLDTFEGLKMTYPKTSAKRRQEMQSIRKRLAK